MKFTAGSAFWGAVSTMQVSSIILAVITLMGVLITVCVTWLIAQRQILAQHVTGERAKWRKNVRAQALEVHDAILCGDAKRIGRLQSEFRALLNPIDCHDQAILDCMTVEETCQQRETGAKEFAERISLLLKHDWERAKLEAGFFLRRWVQEPRRLPLDWRDGGDSGNCAGRKLRWWKRNRIKWSGVLALGLGGALVLVILMCIWEDIPWKLTDERGTAGVATDVGKVQRASDNGN